VPPEQTNGRRVRAGDSFVVSRHPRGRSTNGSNIRRYGSADRLWDCTGHGPTCRSYSEVAPTSQRHLTFAGWFMVLNPRLRPIPRRYRAPTDANRLRITRLGAAYVPNHCRKTTSLPGSTCRTPNKCGGGSSARAEIFWPKPFAAKRPTAAYTRRNLPESAEGT